MHIFPIDNGFTDFLINKWVKEHSDDSLADNSLYALDCEFIIQSTNGTLKYIYLYMAQSKKRREKDQQIQIQVLDKRTTYISF